MHRLVQMPETPTPPPHTHLVVLSSQVVRQHWLDFFKRSADSRSVAENEIEPGLYIVVVPASCRTDTRGEILEVEVRVATSRVPAMARGVRLPLNRLGDFNLTSAGNYQGWMGEWGQQIAAGQILVTAFVDLAYLEAALLSRLWDHGVIVDFNSPLAFFRRGALSDYVDVYGAAVRMLVEGYSIADTAEDLAATTLKRLQLYANVYHQFSSLYAQAVWQIERDNFVAKVPGSGLTFSLQYWELRGDHAPDEKVMLRWRTRIEGFLHNAASNPRRGYPKSFAA